jgi:hypothetical protein
MSPSSNGPTLFNADWLTKLIEGECAGSFRFTGKPEVICCAAKSGFEKEQGRMGRSSTGIFSKPRFQRTSTWSD